MRGPDHALLPPWLREFAEDRPGLRVIAARATRIGAGVAGGGLSRFTSAFVTALEEAPGDMRVARTPFISDKLALTDARRVLGERWGVTHLPLDVGTFGGMPLTRSQKAAPIGEAAVEAVVPGSGFSAAITWRIEGRANMPTTLYYALEDAASRVVAEGATTVMAQDPLQKGKERVRFSPKVVKRAGHSTQQRAGALKWRVSLMDARGRVLAERVVDHP
ncbi:MAG: hypothetical protein IPM54_22460 [Polyangiaceae bacterium]|nr:hypothetical protein [Polyangiaceae bacterium]